MTAWKGPICDYLLFTHISIIISLLLFDHVSWPSGGHGGTANRKHYFRLPPCMFSFKSYVQNVEYLGALNEKLWESDHGNTNHQKSVYVTMCHININVVYKYVV